MSCSDKCTTEDRDQLLQNIADLKYQLKVAREDCHQLEGVIRDKANSISPAFFLVWNENGPWAPRYKHLSHADAKSEAKRLAALHPDQRFYVLAEAGHARAESVMWSCRQSHWDEDIPF